MVNSLLYISSRVDPDKGERCRLAMSSYNTGNNMLTILIIHMAYGQHHRGNAPTGDKDTYCKLILTIPILDHILI